MPTTTMTANWVKAVASPETGRTIWYDEKVTGLGLRVSASGKKTWFVEYRVKGDRTKRNLTLDPYPVMGLADARERAQEVVLAAGRAQDPAAKKQEEKGAPTFAKLAETYMERYAKHEKKSWKKDEWYLNAVLLPAFGKRKAHEVRRRDVLALLEEAKVQRGPILANRTLALVRKIYNWGIEQDLVEVNPCQQVKRVAQETESDRVLSDAELRAIWAALEKQDLAAASLYKLELLTAQRGQEVRTMRWRDLDLEGGWWTIPAEFTKNELSHRVPLTAPAVAIVEALKTTSNGSDWVFPSSRATDMPISGARTALEDVRRLSEVDFRPHDFRRTAASLMTGLGIPRFVVSRVLNHVETGVTRVYDRHSYDSEKRQALEAWSKRLTAIVGGDALHA